MNEEFWKFLVYFENGGVGYWYGLGSISGRAGVVERVFASGQGMERIYGLFRERVRCGTTQDLHQNSKA
jgi:hypothetical protein